MDLSVDGFLAGEVLLVNKPLEWTSFDVVNKIRYSLKRYLGIKKIKVGHAGTLDPLATGLVIVCTGKATKQIDQFLGLDKQYVANIRLGNTTPSYDLETEPDAYYPWEHVTKANMEQCLQTFKGDIDQMPPIFSALKVKGQKACDLARKGQPVELKTRNVHISDIKLLEMDGQNFKIDVNCSKGTYIRSLAFDIGKALDSGAHLTGLVRTRIGAHLLEDAMSMEEIEKKLASFVTN